MQASQVPRPETDGLASILCSRTPAGGSSISSWHGRSTAWAARAVAQGVKLGRPKINSTTERKVRKQLAKGVGILRVAKSLGIGTGTVQRIANELR